MKEILIATNNNYKREQFEYLLKDFNLKIKTLEDFNFNDKVDENKDTAVENARLKAQFWFEKTKLPTLGDDSGLEIDALNNEPGIKARRWGGYFEDTVSDEEWLEYLLMRMKDIPYEKRTAKFRSAWVVVLSNEESISREFILPFHILEEPLKVYPKGSPISAVRFDPEYGKMEMELTNEEKWNRLKKEIDNWEDFSKNFEKRKK